ncbi:MAG: nucleotidyltransferase substrate binding protein family [Mucilaginibacter sp.]|nr:nucleotidyltransferase substrate binding protein family [Mucilaginibacter sp.]
MTDYLDSKLTAFEQALKTFKEALLDNPSELERDGAIQRFEYCFDLAWKTLKRHLEKRGFLDLNSPRSVFTAAFTDGIVENEDTWSTIILRRNASVHTYNQKLAETLFSELPVYYDAMYLLLQRLKG